MSAGGLSRFFARPPGLPSRLAAAIDREQADSEKVVGWTQLCIVLLLSALYAASPTEVRTIGGGETVKPVPWVLSAYLAFTILRLALSYRRLLPGWFVALSVLADMTLLMATIWSIHVTYGQPASFYLKAPTLLYVFVFIALRALRFEARYVLLAGASAALGWGVLGAYVLTADPADRMLAHGFVDYLTSNSILIGAEIDKVASIAAVTGVLAISVWRSRLLLVRSVAEAATAKSLARFFPEEVARQIAGSEVEVAVGQGVAREAVILMIDIRGFTPLCSRIAPDDLIALLIEYQSRMVPLIHRHGGVIDKFLGDGVLATFGAVADSPSCAADALGCLEAIIEEAGVWNAERRSRGLFEIEIGAAAASGRVVFGILGDPERLEYTVIGSPVNLAAKLENHNKNLECRGLTDAATYRMAVRQGFTPAQTAREEAAQSVAGVEQPIDLVVLAN